MFLQKLNMQVKTIMQVLKLQIAILSASIMFQFTFVFQLKPQEFAVSS